MKYKKSVKKVDLLDRFNEKCPAECDRPCDDYKELREQYIYQNQIILQPEGVTDSANKEYEIQYDVFKHMYIPGTADSTQSAFIRQHIHRFQLNGEKFSDSVIELCANIVELNELGVTSAEALLEYFSKQKQMNIISKDFIEFLFKAFSTRKIEELVSFCRKVVVCNAWI